MQQPNPFSLDGKTAFIAGASRGLGLAIAQALARAGAHTILAARSASALEEAARELREEGCSAETVELDIADAASRERAASSVGDVDILFNVAGMNMRYPFEDYPRDAYDRLLEVNLHGIVHLTQLIGKKMIVRGKGGKVVFIGSLTSLTGLPYLSMYTITKAGLAGLTKALAAEWGQHNIQVNCIAPGFILTDLNRGMWQQAGMKEWLHGAQANPEMGKTADLGPISVFLSCAGSDYITGQTIAVDGGYLNTAVWPFKP